MSRVRAATATSRSSGVSASHTAGGGAGIPSSRTSCCTRHLLGLARQIIGTGGREAAQQSVDDRAGVAEVVESTERPDRRPRADLVRVWRAAERSAGCPARPERRAVLARARVASFVEVGP